VWFCGLSLAVGGSQPSQPSGPPPVKLEAQLIWGTNDKESPKSNHKPVSPELKKKLDALPLKWTNYFEERRQRFEVPAGGSTKVPLSKTCAIEVKDLGSSKIEVSHFGKGEHTLKRVQKLPKGDIFVLGGNAPNETSWLVILKRVD